MKVADFANIHSISFYAAIRNIQFTIKPNGLRECSRRPFLSRFADFRCQ